MILLEISLISILFCSILPDSYEKHVHIGVNLDRLTHYPDSSSYASDLEASNEVDVTILHSLGIEGNESSSADDHILFMKFSAFGRVVSVDLQRIQTELAGDDTPVFIARGSINDSNSATFEKTENHTLGKAVTLYQDHSSESSIAVLRHDDGEPFFTGIISGFRVRYQPISDRKRKREAQQPLIDGLLPSTGHMISKIPHKERNADSLTPLLPPFVSRVARDADSSNSSRIYPQLLVVTNYDLVANSSSLGFYDHLVYVLAFFNGVDLVYQQLSDPEIHLRISAIVVNSEPAAAPYINNNRNATGAIDAVAALDQMGEFYAKNLTDLSPDSYDIVITLINDYICDDHEEDFCSPILAGVSSLDKRCSDNHPAASMLAIVEDNSAFSGLRTAVHELGHIMGAEHDGEEEAVDCPFADGYLMSRYNDSSTVSLTWSNCSRRYFTKELNSKEFDCLRDVPSSEVNGGPLPLILPGDVRDLHDQCLRLGYARACLGPQNCQALTCTHSAYPFTLDCEKSGIPAAQGSYCDFYRRCINGHCLPAP